MGIGTIFKKFLLSRQVEMEKGKFSIAGVRQVSTPVSTMVNVQEEIIKKLGNDGAKILYMAGKIGGRELVTIISKKTGLSGSKMIDALTVGCTEMMGWGIVTVISCDLKKHTISFKVEDSPLSVLRHPSAFCHLERGQIAGAIEAIFNHKVDCIEVRCRSMGHHFCQFDIKPTEEFDPKDRLVQEQLPLGNITGTRNKKASA